MVLQVLQHTASSLKALSASIDISSSSSTGAGASTGTGAAGGAGAANTATASTTSSATTTMNAAAAAAAAAATNTANSSTSASASVTAGATSSSLAAAGVGGGGDPTGEPAAPPLFVKHMDGMLANLLEVQNLVRERIQHVGADLPFENVTLRRLIESDLAVQRTAHVHRALVYTLTKLGEQPLPDAYLPPGAPAGVGAGAGGSIGGGSGGGVPMNKSNNTNKTGAQQQATMNNNSNNNLVASMQQQKQQAKVLQTQASAARPLTQAQVQGLNGSQLDATAAAARDHAMADIAAGGPDPNDMEL